MHVGDFDDIDLDLVNAGLNKQLSRGFMYLGQLLDCERPSFSHFNKNHRLRIDESDLAMPLRNWPSESKADASESFSGESHDLDRNVAHHDSEITSKGIGDFLQGCSAKRLTTFKFAIKQ